jgi:hypothetical protein
LERVSSAAHPQELPMAHSVEVNITSHPLSREENGIVFVVTDDEGRFGELVISKGGVRWRPKNKHDHHFMRWAEFDRMMREAKKG